MSEAAFDPVTGEPVDGPGPESKTIMFDAGPLVGFAAANRIRLLNDLMDRMDLDRAVPWFVDHEVKGKDSKYPGVKNRWSAYANSDRVNVLPEVTLAQGDPEVAALLVRLRPTPGTAWHDEDLGEYLTIATALVWRRRGYKVVVSIDDKEGSDLAKIKNLPNLRTEDLVRLCIRAQLLKSWNEVVTLWGQLSKYSRLPRLRDTDLEDEWKRSGATSSAAR